MKTLFISSSLNPNSHSRKVLTEVANQLKTKPGVETTWLDLKEHQINFPYQERTPHMDLIAKRTAAADNIIIGMSVHNYGLNAHLKLMLDTCFEGREHQLFGTVCAAGGAKSYLATTQLMQTMMNSWRMIPLPRVIYSTKHDFDEDNQLFAEEIAGRIDCFVNEFYTLGQKLLS